MKIEDPVEDNEEDNEEEEEEEEESEEESDYDYEDESMMFDDVWDLQNLKKQLYLILL